MHPEFKIGSYLLSCQHMRSLLHLAKSTLTESFSEDVVADCVCIACSMASTLPSWVATFASGRRGALCLRVGTWLSVSRIAAAVRRLPCWSRIMSSHCRAVCPIPSRMVSLMVLRRLRSLAMACVLYRLMMVPLVAVTCIVVVLGGTGATPTVLASRLASCRCRCCPLGTLHLF